MSRQITINEALEWQKTLKERHTELVQLRNENSATVTRYRGIGADKEDKREPVYDVKHLDRLISAIALDLRKLALAIKATNATAVVTGYSMDEAILGEVQ